MLLHDGRLRPSRRARSLTLVAMVGMVACQLGGGSKFPGDGTPLQVPAEHAQVRTLNEGYQRTRSKVLVREIERPTRAALDYAAYHANFMIADPEPEGPASRGGAADTSKPFHGMLDKGTLTSDIKKTSLTDAERREPLAFSPLVQFLESRKVAGAEDLEELGGAVRSESWGLGANPGTPPQAISEVYLHRDPKGTTEIWAKLEFQPWFKGLGSLPDQDHDGFPEVYGRVRPDLVKPAVVTTIQRDYAGQALTPLEVKGWANQLSSYWYPSFNTDLIPSGSAWPDDRTEADIKSELNGKSYPSPTIVLRGKPQGKPTYDIFLVKTPAPGSEQASGGGVLTLPKTKPAPDPRPTAKTIEHELATQGKGSFARWAADLAPFDEAVSRKLKSSPVQIKAFSGLDGYLFYRRGLEYVVGGDLENQKPGKNPLPIIVEFKKILEAHGVDFLFVPVPDKIEVFPDKLDPKFKSLVGQVVNSHERKFLAGLADKGVEVIDLLPIFLAARASGDGAGGVESLYQHQDTHWTDRGLRLAADTLGARIKKYAWYPAVAAHGQTFKVKETSFTRLGDLQSRLPDAEKRKYKPETLVAHQIVRSDGKPYDDDPDSPIVVLGDSFTGVYELTDAEHAGVSAHIARATSYPVDLVMSYGGGPNVRQKLMRRGADALDSKKLVIWIMTARDLFDYWENWEPLRSK